MQLGAVHFSVLYIEFRVICLYIIQSTDYTLIYSVHVLSSISADLFAMNFSIQLGQSGDKQFGDPSTESPWMR